MTVAALKFKNEVYYDIYGSYALQIKVNINTVINCYTDP